MQTDGRTDSQIDGFLDPSSRSGPAQVRAPDDQAGLEAGGRRGPAAEGQQPRGARARHGDRWTEVGTPNVPQERRKRLDNKTSAH